ncbi:MAG: FHA domain-containing protein [Armatimonadota bacterium]|nr:FHA domain-containing protein [Armatimonadota bacterium]
MPYLVGLTGPYTGEAFEIKSGRTAVGRGPACDLVLDRDPAVSRAQAELVSDGGVIRVRDAGSTHGTYVNGRRVDEALLRPSDCVQFGASLFQVQHVPAQVGEAPRLKVIVRGSAQANLPGQEPVVSPALGCLLVVLAVLIPLPVGLMTGMRYLKRSHPANQQFGIAVLVLSLVSLVLQLWLTAVVLRPMLMLLRGMVGPLGDLGG